jgi:hypothetical protein
MIHGEAANHPPLNLETLQRWDQQRPVITASGGLSIVELPPGHGGSLCRRRKPATTYYQHLTASISSAMTI